MEISFHHSSNTLILQTHHTVQSSLVIWCVLLNGWMILPRTHTPLSVCEPLPLPLQP